MKSPILRHINISCRSLDHAFSVDWGVWLVVFMRSSANRGKSPEPFSEKYIFLIPPCPVIMIYLHLISAEITFVIYNLILNLNDVKVNGTLYHWGIKKSVSLNWIQGYITIYNMSIYIITTNLWYKMLIIFHINFTVQLEIFTLVFLFAPFPLLFSGPI